MSPLRCDDSSRLPWIVLILDYICTMLHSSSHYHGIQPTFPVNIPVMFELTGSSFVADFLANAIRIVSRSPDSSKFRILRCKYWHGSTIDSIVIWLNSVAVGQLRFKWPWNVIPCSISKDKDFLRFFEPHNNVVSAGASEVKGIDYPTNDNNNNSTNY